MAQPSAHPEVLVDSAWVLAHLDDDAPFKILEELTSVYSGDGLTPDKSVISHCLSVSAQPIPGSC